MIESGFEDYLEHYEPNRVLFHQDDPADCFYVIKEGLVDIVRTEDGIEESIATLGPGEVLGEVGLLDPEESSPRSASAVSETELACWKFDRAQFDQLMANNDQFRKKILGYLASRLRRTSGELARANMMEDQLYDCSLALLRLINRENVYLGSSRELTLSPPIGQVVSFLNLEQEDLEILLSAPGSDQLSRLSEDQEATARAVSRRIIQRGLNSLEFVSDEQGKYGSSQSDEEMSELREACEAGERLNDELERAAQEMTRDRYEAIWDQFERIKECLQSQRNDPDSDDTLIRRLQAYVKGIRQKLRSINRDNLNS